jgi:hypothetical protein
MGALKPSLNGDRKADLAMQPCHSALMVTSPKMSLMLHTARVHMLQHL